MSAAAATTGNSCCSRQFVKPSPLFVPALYKPSRYKNVACNKFATNSTTQSFPKLSCGASKKVAALELSSLAFQDKPHSYLSAASASFFSGDRDEYEKSQTTLPSWSKSLIIPRAYKDAFSLRYPVITEKPTWWWRTLACVPYLLALQISDAGHFIQPLTEHYPLFENLIYFVPGAITRLPVWFSMAYCYFAYLCVIRNKEWPHFLRFHLMMGMLLETSLQIVWHVGNFFPFIHFRGMFGMHVWAAVGFAYILILLQCIRCALFGMYAHIPFISDAAYIHTLFNIGGFHRFF
ncbi:hypothetical protein ACFE04_018287 [Oxalis oulophora]